MRYNTDITVCIDSLKSALNIASNNPTQSTLNVTVIASPQSLLKCVISSKTKNITFKIHNFTVKKQQNWN